MGSFAALRNRAGLGRSAPSRVARPEGCPLQVSPELFLSIPAEIRGEVLLRAGWHYVRRVRPADQAVRLAWREVVSFQAVSATELGVAEARNANATPDSTALD